MGKMINVRVSEAEHEYCHQGGDASGLVRRLIQNDMMNSMMNEMQQVVHQRMGRFAMGGSSDVKPQKARKLGEAAATASE